MLHISLSWVNADLGLLLDWPPGWAVGTRGHRTTWRWGLPAWLGMRTFKTLFTIITSRRKVPVPTWSRCRPQESLQPCSRSKIGRWLQAIWCRTGGKTSVAEPAYFWAAQASGSKLSGSGKTYCFFRRFSCFRISTNIRCCQIFVGPDYLLTRHFSSD